MDRVMVYPGAVPLETDILSTNKNAMIGLSALAAAMFGSATTGMIHGLPVNANSPAALNVVVGAGEIYEVENVDSAAYSSLAADTTHQIVKQGINLNSTVLACPAPSTVGYSVTYLIEATYADVDGLPVQLPYYNASNPSQAYSGPNNSGATNNTVRQGQVSLYAKAGIAAATGTQVAPTVDGGYLPVALVTVAYGQTTINAANISVAPGAPFIGAGALNTGRLLNVQTFTASGNYTPTPGTNSIVVECVGGGGGGGGGSSTTSSQIAIPGGAGGGAGAIGRFTSGFANGLAVTIGAAGSIGAGVAGGNGGTSALGALISASGGNGGGAGSATTYTPGTPTADYGSLGGTAVSGATIKSIPGGQGTLAIAVQSGFTLGSGGGSSMMGPGAPCLLAPGAGLASGSPGGGGGGSISGVSSAATIGGAGGAGKIIIYEYA